MTQYEFDGKIKELLFDVNSELYKEMHRLFKCGGVEPEQYEDNYLLPKMLLTAALGKIVNAYAPMDKEYIQVIKNLKHF